MKEWYQMREDEVLEALGSDANGLSSEKAEALLKTHGENVLRETKEKCMACLCRAVCRSSGYYSYHCCDYFNDLGKCGEHDCYICGYYDECDSWHSAA